MPKKPLALISLYSGAGGLDIGLEEAGFSVKLCVEKDDDSRSSLAANRKNWRLADPGDIHRIKPQEILAQAGLQPRELSLLAGGPPCQPFSKSGYWARVDSKPLKDVRSRTLRAYLKVLAAALPEAMLLENVQGITFDRRDHGFRLLQKGIEVINRAHGVSYAPTVVRLNASDYGVPQLRERLFIVAHRDGLPFEVPKPRPDQYRTAWDAIGNLDCEDWPEELSLTGKWADLLPSIPEGQNYLWHTDRSGGRPIFGWRTRYWSFLLKLAKDHPSWTIQAEPGPATGPFHWKNRKLSIRELCRLQTFPDNYEIVGGYRSAHRQVGNAVPPALGELMGLELRRQFWRHPVRKNLRLVLPLGSRCPPPDMPEEVPSKYLQNIGQHKAHPGVGKGPGALKRKEV